jgi:glycerol-3-phosphate dehydrogenase (NAD(P)+)
MAERRRPRVAVLGVGSWGTCVGSITSRSAPTVLWARNAERAQEIDQRHTNETYLPGAKLPNDLRGTSSLVDAVGEADVRVSAIPAQSLRSVLSEVASLVRPCIPVPGTAGSAIASHLRTQPAVAVIPPASSGDPR